MSPEKQVSRWPWGLIGMAVMVVAIEGYVARRHLAFTNTATLSWNLSDAAARRDATDADVLCFGDSLVKHGMIPEVLEAKLNQRVYNLSICAASAPASYFLLKHAIDAGARPKSIIVDFMPDLLTGSPRHSSRNWPEILNYRELIELARAGRDFGFFVTMARDRLLNSYRSRWEIRSNLTAAIQGKEDPLPATNLVYRRNWGLHRGAEYTPDNPAYQGQVTEDDHFKLMSDHFWCNRVNRDYIHKFVKLAESRGAKIYWLLPPVSPGIHKRRVESGADEKYSQFIREIAASHPTITVLDARRSGYDHTKFVDPVHLNGRGGVALSTEVAEAMLGGRTTWVWLPRYRDRQSPVPLEDVEQSRLAVGAGTSTYR
jgi:hypothetical protein